jgi:CBS domain-containing protein
LAAVLLAVELLLFEWRPRSFVPVAAAVATATLVRGFLLGSGAIFPVATGGVQPGALDNVLCLVSGVTGGLLAVAATAIVYLAEDAFHRLPLHWMWWPAIGGLIIGLGGLIEPRALGVGYDVIDELLTGRAGISLIVGILVVKTAIWSLSLGSGTSGGVLAPIFMIGGALGAAEAHVLPTVFPGFWAMMGLAAVVGGVMRSPLTGVVFTLELTHAWSAILPLIIASTTAYGLSALALKRSVLTEKIARRGLHLTREYSTDPLEAFFAADVMASPVTVVPPSRPLREVVPDMGGQRLFPVVDGGELVGVVTSEALAMAAGYLGSTTVGDLMTPSDVAVFDDDTLRHVANVFAEHGITRAPVVSRQDPGDVRGVICLEDLLQARKHDLTEETHRERHLAAGRRVVFVDSRPDSRPDSHPDGAPAPSHLRAGGPG